MDLGQGSANCDAWDIQIDLEELIKTCSHSAQVGDLLASRGLALLVR